jgi:cellobiose-specific phosphotransferase system component IIA
MTRLKCCVAYKANMIIPAGVAGNEHAIMVSCTQFKRMTTRGRGGRHRENSMTCSVIDPKTGVLVCRVGNSRKKSMEGRSFPASGLPQTARQRSTYANASIGSAHSLHQHIDRYSNHVITSLCMQPCYDMLLTNITLTTRPGGTCRCH